MKCKSSLNLAFFFLLRLQSEVYSFQWLTYLLVNPVKLHLHRFCNEGVPCPQPIFWSPWGSWTKCSTECGGGIHSRVRTCENGNSCPGCALVGKTHTPPPTETHIQINKDLQEHPSISVESLSLPPWQDKVILLFKQRHNVAVRKC